MSHQTEFVYRTIIDDVIRNSRDDFMSEGVDEQTLNALQRIWETKLLQHTTNVAAAAEYDNTQYAADPYGQTAAYLHQPMQQQQQVSPAAASMAAVRAAVGRDDSGKPQQFLNKAVAGAGPGRAPGYLSQHDGADDEAPPSVAALDATLERALAARRVAQYDGEGDSDEDDGAGPSAAAAPQDDDEGNLSSISLDDDDDEDDNTETDNEVLCQYDKVSHTKNSKWRAVLKDGIMHIGGRDYLFSKATGEFTW